MSTNKKRILIMGSGGHARVVADTIEQLGEYEIAGFVDNVHIGRVYKDYDIIGTDDDLKKLYDQGITCAAMGIGYLGEGELRSKLYSQLKTVGFELPAIVDKTAAVADDVEVAEGVYVGKLVVVNSGADLGVMSIVNSGSIVEHDCKLGAFSHVAVGATVCGGASIGEACLIGAGAVVIQEKTVGNNAIIGAGSVVLENVNDYQKVAGVPARVL